jgi:hypothetical protein
MRAACKDNCKFFGQTLLTCVISNPSAISFYFLHCTNETRGMQAHVMSGTASFLETCKHDFSVEMFSEMSQSGILIQNSKYLPKVWVNCKGHMSEE